MIAVMKLNGIKFETVVDKSVVALRLKPIFAQPASSVRNNAHIRAMFFRYSVQEYNTISVQVYKQWEKCWTLMTQNSILLDKEKEGGDVLFTL